MLVSTARYCDQRTLWPKAGRHILAQYTDEHLVVYQAYRPSIAAYAVAHQRFGGEFSFSRMSWIKPGFLWMMYRSGWATKQDQEVVLALFVRRAAFVSIQEQAVPSTFWPGSYPSETDWKRAVARSDVRLQWDPDHGPGGGPLPRRAIQIGVRGAVLRSLMTEWLLGIEDLTEFVAEQRGKIASDPGALVTPEERVFPVPNELASRIGVEREPGS